MVNAALRPQVCRARTPVYGVIYSHRFNVRVLVGARSKVEGDDEDEEVDAKHEEATHEPAAHRRH